MDFDRKLKALSESQAVKLREIQRLHDTISEKDKEIDALKTALASCRGQVAAAQRKFSQAKDKEVERLRTELSKFEKMFTL